MVVGVKSSGQGIASFKCVTDQAALDAVNLDKQIATEIASLKNKMNEDSALSDEISKQVNSLLDKISKFDLPHFSSLKHQEQLIEIQSNLRSASRLSHKELGMKQIKDAIENQKELSYFCYYLDMSSADKFNMNSALKLVPSEKPSLIILHVGNEIKAKAKVSSSAVSKGVIAKDWLNVVAEIVGGKVSAPRGQDENLNCNLMGGQPPDKDGQKQIMSQVNNYVSKLLQ